MTEDLPNGTIDIKADLSTNPVTARPDAGREALENLKVQQAMLSSGDPGAENQDANPTTTDHSNITKGTINVDWNGTTREMPVEELVQAAQKSEEADALQRVAQEQLAKASQANELASLMDKLTPEQQQEIIAIAHKDPQRDDDDFDPDFDASSQQTSQTPEGERIRQLEQVVNSLVQVTKVDQTERQERSLGEQVQQVVGQFPVFKEDAELSQFAMDKVNAEVAAARANGDVSQKDIETIVATSATQMHKVLQGLNSPPAEVEGSANVPRFTPPEKPFTAKEMGNGSIARMLHDQYLSGRRM